MSAALNPYLIRFSSISGRLYSQSSDDIRRDVNDLLTKEGPQKAEGEEPCLAIPQANHFTLRLPGANGHLCISDQTDEHLFVEVFWALDENDVPVLIVYNMNIDSRDREFIALREDDGWKTMPTAGQIYRRFAKAKDAHERFPNGDVVISTTTPPGSNHLILDYHSDGGAEPGGGYLWTSPTLHAKMRLEQFAMLFWRHESRPVGHTMFNLPENLCDMAVVAFGHSSDGSVVIVLKETDVNEKRSFVRYHRLSFTFAGYQKLLANAEE